MRNLQFLERFWQVFKIREKNSLSTDATLRRNKNREFELCIAFTIQVSDWFGGDKCTVIVKYANFDILKFIRLLRFLLWFLNNHNILSDSQYGFRKHHSTAYALACLYDKISSAIENKEHTVGIFIDLFKAFDTVDHNILISKLEHYGVRGTALRWLKSYLSNRQQYVEFNGVSSESLEIKCGVSQGSILGPLLFLLYTNDLCNASKVVDFIIFADDRNLFFPSKTLIYFLKS